VAFAILLPVAAHTLWDYIELQRLIREIEAITDAGEPVQVGHDDVEPYTGQRSAGSYYVAAALLYPRGASPLYTSLGTAAGLYPMLVELRRPAAAATAGDTAGILERLRTSVTDAAEALKLADMAATLEYRGLPYDTDYSYRTADVSAVLATISARTVALAAGGEADAAVDSAIVGLRMRRILRDVSNVFVVSDFQTAAILSLSSPSLSALERLQRVLDERDDDGARIVAQIVRDRARTIEAFWQRYYGNDPRAPRVYRLPWRGIVERVMRPVLTHSLVGMIRTWDKAIAVARTPWPRKAAAAGELVRPYDANPARDFPLWSIIPTATARYVLSAPAGLRQLERPAELIAYRASRTAVALERFRRDNGGAIPESLDALVPRYLAQMPQDPLSGSPMRYRSDEQGYTIYSVGTNNQDDGGELVQDPPRGVARPRPGGDIGIRVWTTPE
jgi:hypothetical protein